MNISEIVRALKNMEPYSSWMLAPKGGRFCFDAGFRRIVIKFQEVLWTVALHSQYDIRVYTCIFRQRLNGSPPSASYAIPGQASAAKG